MSWLKLKEKFGISVLNKVHIITDYLIVYLTKFKRTLHNSSDQTTKNTQFSKRMEAGNYNVKNFRSKIHGEKCSGGSYTLILSIMDMVFNKINFSNICSCIYLVDTQLIYLINWSYLSAIKTTNLNVCIFFHALKWLTKER